MGPAGHMRKTHRDLWFHRTPDLSMPASIHSWGLSIPLAVALVLTALLYLRGWIHLQRSLPEMIPGWRAVSFLCGLLTVWLAVGSPLAVLDEQLLTAHMVQHILLMTVGAPLILLGSPVLLLLSHDPKLGHFFRRAPTQHMGGILIFCWFAGAAALMGWHIPAAFELGLRSELLHHVEHATFLTAGLLFWWPVIPSWTGVPQRRWSLVLYLFLATLPCDALSAFLAFCGRVVYAPYLDVPRHFNLSPLQDQECAGALMWTCATFAYLIPAVIITTRLLSASGAGGRRIPPTTSEGIPSGN
jgi:cytochrome c oxidase assembly factor CtaG